MDPTSCSRAAGNIRVEGLYADLQTGPSDRLSDRSVVRVGANTSGTVLPGPSGLVDYSLRRRGEHKALGARVGVDSFGEATMEVDGGVRLRDTLSLNAGGAFVGGDDFRGTRPTSWSAGIVSRWKPSDRFELTTLYERTGTRRHVEPFYYTAGPFLLRRVRRGRFLGEPWSDYRAQGENIGAIVDTALARGLSIKAGAFASTNIVPTDTFDLIEGVTGGGIGQRTVYRFPRQRYRSLSGEARLAYEWGSRIRQRVTLAVRGRRVDSRYGGELALPIGPAQIDTAPTTAAPVLLYAAPQTSDRTRQTIVALGYRMEWARHVELDLGVGRADYRKTVATPPNAPSANTSSPLLYSALVGWRPNARTLIYATAARGIEASGVAPTGAINRNSVLPAILTKQRELGARTKVANLAFAAALFEIDKPYAALRPDGVFALDGQVRHRGVEASLSGTLAPGLDLVLGAVAIDGRVTGPLVAAGQLGRRPIAVPDYRAQLAVNYAPAWARRLSFDVVADLTGPQDAKLDGGLRLPVSASLDIGARSKASLGRTPVELRAQVLNLFDAYTFTVASDEAFFYVPARSARLTITADF